MQTTQIALEIGIESSAVPSSILSPATLHAHLNVGFACSTDLTEFIEKSAGRTQRVMEQL